MQQHLSDTERTLLSAYLDGELSGVEHDMAERLIARSTEARGYLRDLQAVNSFSSDLFLAMPSGGLGGAVVAEKLSGGTITSAASKGVIAKNLFSGGWGMAGLAAAAVAVTVGIGVLMQRDDVSTDHVAPHHAGTIERTQTGSTAAAPIISLDTTALIVPAITPAELVGFAVEGTLPIDQERERFITVAPKGGDSICVTLHRSQPDHRAFLAEPVRLDGMKGIDSIKLAIRTALLRYSNNSFVIRGDLPALRFKTLQRLAAAPRLSQVTRRAVVEAKRDMVVTQARAMGGFNDGHEVSEDVIIESFEEFGRPIGDGVPYIQIGFAEASWVEEGEFRISLPMPSTRSGGRHAVMVSGGSIGTIEACAARNSAPMPVPYDVFVARHSESRAREEVDNPTGSTPRSARGGENAVPVIMDAPQRQELPTIQRPQHSDPFGQSDGQRLNPDYREIQEMLDNAERLLRHVDSLRGEYKRRMDMQTRTRNTRDEKDQKSSEGSSSPETAAPPKE